MYVLNILYIYLIIIRSKIHNCHTSSENFGILSFGWNTTTTSLVAFGFKDIKVLGNTERMLLFCKHCVDGVIVRLKSTVAKLLLVIRTARFSFSLTLTTPRLTLRSLGFNTSTWKIQRREVSCIYNLSIRFRYKINLGEVRWKLIKCRHSRKKFLVYARLIIRPIFNTGRAGLNHSRVFFFTRKPDSRFFFSIDFVYLPEICFQL